MIKIFFRYLGKPLRISLIDGDDSEANDPFSNYLRQSQRNVNNNNQRQRNGNSNQSGNYNQNRTFGGGNKRNGRNGPPPSAEDLDREMDEWRMLIEQDGDVKMEENVSIDDDRSLMDV